MNARRAAHLAATLCLALSVRGQPAPGASGFNGFTDRTAVHERTASFTLEPEVKVEINAPAAPAPARKTVLIFYALPNGNTIGQTIGRKLQPGDDWHFDIQHIGTQTRFLRQALPDRNIVVVYLQANQRSWPAWRKKHGDAPLPGLLDSIRKIVATPDPEIVLSGHSGGGSFIFGCLNAATNIPDNIVRLAFLDSDYAYDPALGHTEKFQRWLEASPQHRLCVIAYNDAAALANGKPFVSASGGTWGRSHLMLADLGARFKFTRQTAGDLETDTALGGQIKFLLMANPEHKILHTVQVERNGFIEAMLSGTTNEAKGYQYFAPRAYEKWIDK
jgi:hypothetical protein